MWLTVDESTGWIYDQISLRRLAYCGSLYCDRRARDRKVAS